MKIELKRGDSLVWEVEYLDDVGVPVDLTSYVIRCQARDSLNLVLFDVTSADASIDVHTPLSGKFRIVIDTAGFETKTYDVDIEYAIGGVIKSSETFSLVILKDITQ